MGNKALIHVTTWGGAKDYFLLNSDEVMNTSAKPSVRKMKVINWNSNKDELKTIKEKKKV